MEKQTVANLLIEKNITIGSAESLTGGMFASAISSFPGISKVYKGSIVSYSTLIKNSVLKIDKTITDSVGVVSSEVAYYMAKNVKKILDVDLAVSFTGNAGPSAMEDKPVGLVYIGIAYLDKIEVYEYRFDTNLSRQKIREKCVDEAFELIYKKIF